MDQLRTCFATPQREFSPVATWWWSAGRLDAERLSWQLRQMAQAGLHNIVIISLAPVGTHLGTPIDEPRTFTDAWWELFLGVCAEARELGVRLWMYDQIGFSSANFQEHLILTRPDFEGQRIERLEVPVTGPARVQCPGQGTAVSAVSVGDDGTVVPLQVHGDEVRWNGGSARICLFYTVCRGFDYFNPDACTALRDIVLGEFERRAGDYFGDVIVGSFQDELDRMPSWSDDFTARFIARHGYDLVPRLASLWEGDRLEDRRVRIDYQQTRDELGQEAFFRPFFAWHEDRGLTCGFDQKYPGRAGQPVGSIELYGDYFATQRWYGAPGSDHGGETKIHSSLAHLYGRPRVWLEAFHSTGWGGTLEETFDWLLPRLRAGATLYNPHAVYYTTQQGWWEWAPPSTCWRQPYWRHYRQFADAVTRLCAVLGKGTHRCDIALLYPTVTIQGGVSRTGPSSDARAADATYERLVGRHDMVRSNVRVGALDAARRDFDIVDDPSLGAAIAPSDGDGPASLRIGAEEYRAVVLPHCTVLTAEVARTLSAFLDRGGIVLAVGAVPEHSTDSAGADAVTALRRRFGVGRARLVASPEDVAAALDELCPPQVEAAVPTLLREVDGRTVLFVPAAHPGATRLEPVAHRKDWAYTFDPKRYHRSLDVVVRGVTTAPELWDVTTGAARPVRCTATADGVRVTVPFDDGPAALLVWPEAAGAAPASRSGPDIDGSGVEECVTDLDGGWTGEVVPTVDISVGDDPRTADRPDQPVQTWHVEHALPAASPAWVPAKATHGTYGWNAGPCPPGDLPRPDGRLDELSDAWTPAVYSLSHGLATDPLHQPAFGLKGVVPDEFLHFGDVAAGEGVQHKTSVRVDAETTMYLAVSAPAIKQAWLNGVALGRCADRELWLAPVTLRAGSNVIEFRLVADNDRVLRGYWCLVDDPAAFRRPEWLSAAVPARKDSLVTFSAPLQVTGTDARVTMQVNVDTGSATSVRVGDRLLGRQSGRCRVERYQFSLDPGVHEVRVDVLDPGELGEDHASVLVDGVVESGDATQAFCSDETWTVRRDRGDAHPARLARQTWWPARCEPSTAYLQRRPHPLPLAARGAAGPAAARPVVPDARPGQDREELLRWVVPAGATAMDVPVRGTAVLTLDDSAEVVIRPGWTSLPGDIGRARVAVLRVRPEPGRTQGALLSGPVGYRMASGRVELGDWADLGLGDWSGGLRYRREVQLDRPRPGRRLLLDLGAVRGTAEVTVNDRTVGARVWSPYRVDITDAVQDGPNTIEVLVLNTLASVLAAQTPTPYVFPGQTRSGLFGPVRVLSRAEATDTEVTDLQEAR